MSLFIKYGVYAQIVKGRVYTPGTVSVNRQIYEIDLDTRTNINTFLLANTNIIRDMGGIKKRLYGVDVTSNIIIEFNPDTMAVLSSAGTESNNTGCGGTESRMYKCDRTGGNEKFYEINVDTKAVINSAAAFSTLPWGIGGIKDRLYSGDRAAPYYLRELNKDTFAQINAVVGPTNDPRGIGGTKDRLYHSSGDLNRWELNVDTLVAIGSGVLGTVSEGIGGIK